MSRKVMWFSIGAGLMVAGAAATLVALGAMDSEDEAPTPDTSETDTSSAWLQGVFQDSGTAGMDESTLLNDMDKDGLPDVMENYVYGSDPAEWSTTGEGIPDGWLARHGYDPTLPGHSFRTASTPDPAELPGAYGGVWRFNWTLSDVYEWGRPAGWDETEDGAFDNGISPHTVSYDPDGIPYAWLHHYGFQPTDADASFEGVKPTPDAFSVMDNYLHNTDPRKEDTDGDGLSDSEEVDQHLTDPMLFSTSRTGIADGWLVLHGLDPKDPMVGSNRVVGKGMTVKETWAYNVANFGLADAVIGQGLSPTKVSTLSLGIPDGWIITHGLDPFNTNVPGDVKQVAGDFEYAYHLLNAPPGHQPISDMALTVKDMYEYGRPETWDETTDGVWWNSLDPNTTDADEDGLPDVIEIRGWYIQVATGVGPSPAMEVRHVFSDPLRADTDSDNLTDAQEYFGRYLHEDRLIVFNLTDPRNTDTAFSGLSDRAKVEGLGLWTLVDDADTLPDIPVPGADDASVAAATPVRPLLDPTKRDTGGSYLADGAELAHWKAFQERKAASLPYPFPQAPDCTVTPWTKDASVLGPGGDVDGDGIPNVVDPDADNDGLLDGWEVRPDLYRHSDLEEFPGMVRPVTDPANMDTDCDGLADGWEAEHTLVVNNAWTLDPANHDSDQDTIFDGEENPDGDVVEWTVYDSSGGAHKKTFSFNNLLESQENVDTDPNIADENGDGVTEGWVYFWGSVYPFMDMSDPDEVGTITPSSDALNNPDFDDLLASVGDQTKYVDADEDVIKIPYRRTIPDVQHVTPDLLLEGEALDTTTGNGEGENPGKTTVYDTNGDQVELFRAVIVGESTHTYALDQKHRLNPYLDDTDGDGVPDSWETLYGERDVFDGCDGLEPATHDSENDPGSGMTNLDTYLNGQVGGQFDDYWINPCLEDSDLDGIPDRIEIDLETDPTDPFEVQQGDGDDTDGDGVFDEQELKDGTDPSRADTDRDGLLDGGDIILSPDWSLAKTWVSLGIAHINQSDGQLRFLGETAIQGDPTDPYHKADGTLILDGVPHGWLAYHRELSVSSEEKAAVLTAAYECNRPDWWDSDRHPFGVWWWGAYPDDLIIDENGDLVRDEDGFAMVDCKEDLDRDGLHDTNGEDPIPAASPDPDVRVSPLDRMENLSVGAVELRKTAQAWGDCAGNPHFCPEPADDAPAPSTLQAPVNITVNTDHPDWTTNVNKTRPFNVTGNVCIYNQTSNECIGVANRTVTLQFDDVDDPTRTLGVNFTNETGNFTIEGCICALRNVSIPHTGMTVHSRDNNTTPVRWDFPVSEIEADTEWTLAVRVLATNALRNDTHNTSHPHYIDFDLDGKTYHATGPNVTVPWSVTVQSATRLQLEAPSNVPWSSGTRTIPATVTLTDATDDPLAGYEVNFTLAGQGLGAKTTDVSGRHTFNIPVDNGMVGPIQIGVEFKGTDNLSASSAGPLEVVLQAPLVLVFSIHDPVDGTPIDPSTEKISAGDSVLLRVNATTFGTPVDTPVRFSIGGVSVTQPTGADGIAEEVLSTQGLQATSVVAKAEVASTAALQGATRSTSLTLISAATFTEVTAPSQVVWKGAAAVSGRLTLQDDTPLKGRPVTIRADGVPLTTVQTGNGGWFQATDLALPGEVSPGFTAWTLEYDGELNIKGTQHTTDLRVIVPTSITLDDQKSSRNEALIFSGWLHDGTGQPLQGQPVNLRVDGVPIGRFITDATGRFLAKWQVPAETEYGTHVLRADFPGSESLIYEASHKTSNLLVRTSTDVTIHPLGNISRTGQSVHGSLVTNEGEPLASATMYFTMDDAPLGVATTGPGGAFSFPVQTETDRTPGAFVLRATYNGTDTYGGSQAGTEGVLTVLPELTTHFPAEVGRGTNATFRATLLDDLGGPIDNASLTLTALEQAHTFRTGPDGVGSVRLDIPSNVTLGEHVVRVQFNGSSGLLPTQESGHLLVKEGSRLTVVDKDDVLDPTAPTRVVIRLTDLRGEPLANQLISVRFAGDPLATVVRTDEDGLATALLSVPPGSDGRLVFRYQGDLAFGSLELITDATPIKAHTAPTASRGISKEWAVILGASAVVVAACMVAFVAWRRVRMEDPLLHALREAKMHIDSERPWDEAIRDAYRKLVRRTALHGHAESESESVREFMQALVQVAPVPPKAAVELTHLFEQATYSDASSDVDEAKSAAKSLQRIILAIETYLGAQTRKGRA